MKTLVTLALGLLVASGCTYTVYTVQPTAYRAPQYVTVGSAPPPPRVAVAQPAQPRSDAYWVAGHWSYEGRWVWIAGQWQVPRAGYAWQQPVAVRVGAGYRYYPGYWHRHGEQSAPAYRQPGTIQVAVAPPRGRATVQRGTPTQTVRTQPGRPAQTVTVQPARPARPNAAVTVQPTRPTTQRPGVVVQPATVRPTRPNTQRPGVVVQPATVRPTRPNTQRPGVVVRPATVRPTRPNTQRPGVVVQPATVRPTRPNTQRPGVVVQPATVRPARPNTQRPGVVVRPATVRPTRPNTQRPGVVVRPATVRPTRPNTQRPGVVVRPATVRPARPNTQRPGVVAQRQLRCRVASSMVPRGGLLTITGSGLSGATVRIGGRVSPVVSSSDSTVQARAPGGSGGAVSVTVGGRRAACGNVRVTR